MNAAQLPDADPLKATKRVLRPAVDRSATVRILLAASSSSSSSANTICSLYQRLETSFISPSSRLVVPPPCLRGTTSRFQNLAAAAGFLCLSYQMSMDFFPPQLLV